MEELRSGDIIRERYSLVRCLGNGSFGEVWLAHDMLTGREVALKIYLTLDPNGIKEFNREYSTTIDLASPYLLTPKYFDVHGRRPFLVMKYCQNGSAAKLAGKISEQQLWQFVHDVARGLEALHTQANPIVHQDIKPDNILIDENGRFLITDFGISTKLRATMRKQSRRDVHSGAIPYMAPERFDATPHLSTASDIWSLGASIYELATGLLPFNGMGGKMVEHGAEIPSLPSTYSPRLNELMQKCLSPNEKDRPSVSEMVEITAPEEPKATEKPATLTDVQLEELRKMITSGKQKTPEIPTNLTAVQLNEPDKVVKLNIRGKVTECKVKPELEFELRIPLFCTYFWLVIFSLIIGAAMVVATNDDTFNFTRGGLLFDVAFLGTLLMWIRGYALVKHWKPIGKYLLCGSSYLQLIWWLYVGISGFKDIIINQIRPLYLNNSPWYSYISPCMGFIAVILIGIGIPFSYVFCVWGIKRKWRKRDPIVWAYQGEMTWPIIMEYVLPAILLALFIVGRVI